MALMSSIIIFANYIYERTIFAFLSTVKRILKAYGLQVGFKSLNENGIYFVNF